MSALKLFCDWTYAEMSGHSLWLSGTIIHGAMPHGLKVSENGVSPPLPHPGAAVTLSATVLRSLSALEFSGMFSKKILNLRQFALVKVTDFSASFASRVNPASAKTLFAWTAIAFAFVPEFAFAFAFCLVFAFVPDFAFEFAFEFLDAAATLINTAKTITLIIT